MRILLVQVIRVFMVSLATTYVVPFIMFTINVTDYNYDLAGAEAALGMTHEVDDPCGNEWG